MKKSFAAMSLGVLMICVLAVGCNRKKDEDVPPMPSAPPPPVVIAPAPVEVAPIVSADPAASNSAAPLASAKKGGPSVSNLMACCNALGSNAKANPNPLLAGTMMQVQAQCESMAKSGNAAQVNVILAQYGKSCR